MAPHLIIGIDPGLTSGGVVLLEGPTERVIAAKSLVARIPRLEVPLGDKAFTAAERHAAHQADAVGAAVSQMRAEHGEIVAIGMESFIDQPHRARTARHIKERWKTPLAIGHICARLHSLGFSSAEGTLIFQDPSILGQFARELGALEARPRTSSAQVVCAGDHLLTNDHLRKAWAHGAWLNIRISKDGTP